jgi:hypothetical protein
MQGVKVACMATEAASKTFLRVNPHAVEGRAELQGAELAHCDAVFAALAEIWI